MPVSALKALRVMSADAQDQVMALMAAVDAYIPSRCVIWTSRS
jgi:translation elongation factor EF-Tu-like GTPase